MKVTRRNFIKVSSIASGGLLLSFDLQGRVSAMKEELPIKINNYLLITSDSRIIFNLTKHEMGQGSGTGLPMILADELGADWNMVSSVRSDYDPVFSEDEMGTTGGSQTIREMWPYLRQAGATAREMLKQAAANRWNVKVLDLKVEKSVVRHQESGQRASFGELAAEAAKLPIPKKVELKPHESFQIIGTSVKNHITKGLVIGKANYGINMELPGMLYASIEKCPVHKGKVKSYDASAAKQVKGVIDVIIMPSITPSNKSHHVQEGIAVIAESTWSAFKGRKALKIEWDLGPNKNATDHQLLNDLQKQAQDNNETVLERGNFKKLDSDAEIKWIEYAYENPYQAHALMEPINATADVHKDHCEVWVGTQSGERMLREVEQITNLPPEKIKIHIQNSGGSFGRRFYADSTMEATYLSKQIGKPVKVTWSREDEISHDYFHPYQYTIHRAGIKNGTVVGWQTRIARTEGYASGDQIWEIPYDFPNIRTHSKQVESIVQVGAWRSVAEHSSSLGRESFMDELALEVGVNPLDFRISLLQEDIKKEGEGDFAERLYAYRNVHRKKYRAVLNRLKELKWMDLPKETGVGRGMAVESFGPTVVAHVVDLSLQPESRKGFKVEKVRTVVHCGTLVNPHFGKGQIEGSIIWALSAVHYGGVQIKDGEVERSNFHDNQLLRIDEVPEIEIDFIPSDEPPTGLGEPATPPLAPAVLNGLFDLTGRRIRKIPVSPEDLFSRKPAPVS